jgi:heme/copper-type cytochrome/quinol oxidase subunit 2
MTTILKRASAVALALALSLPLVFGASLPAQASDLEDNLGDVQSDSDLADASLTEFIGTLISVFISVLGIVLLLLIIYAGFLWMTAGGNTDQVGTAKTIMINSVVGLIILLAAYAISDFVITALANAGLVD